MSISPSQRVSSSDTTTTVNETDAQQFQQIIRDRQYEREDIQKKAFTKWVNNQLQTASSTPAVTDLFQDLRDGVVLLRLLEVLTGNEYKRENGKMRVHHIGNVNKVITVLNEHGIKTLNISSNDIVDGNGKLTLALIWSIIQYWQGKDVMESAAMPDAKQTNIEKFLLSWCQQQTKGYKDVEIQDFTRSWQDGLAFNALMHKFRPDLFDYERIHYTDPAKTLEHAFNVAKTVFKIDRYLDVEDVLAEYPDKKSILMYVMCLFQQLPSSNMVIEESDTSITANTSHDPSTETQSLESNQLSIYRTNMERILKWILTLEDKLDQQDQIQSTDLKTIKEQFQNHEVFMVSLTEDQNQIGQVLQEGNQLLTSTTLHLQTKEETEIKEQMKTLNRRWESLRSKSLDRQSILHKTLMKLQIDQIESFDSWLLHTEERLEKDLEIMEETLPGIDRQYQQLAQLQDELVAQQQITESLQNMVIVIDDSSSDSQKSSTKYTSTAIESKLLNLSERWAQICNFVQNRWIQLQEVKIELEQIELNHQKITQWLTRKEDEMQQMNSSSHINDNSVLMEQVQAIQKTESEMDDIRQSIVSFDNSLKLLRKHYDSSASIELKTLSEQIEQFEQRWKRLIENLEQCSTRLKQANLTVETSRQPTNNPVKTTITTTVEETTTTYHKPDDTETKKNKFEREHSITSDFDLSARKYLDWIDNIERILDDKSADHVKLPERQEIIQEVKAKYSSYDEQFQNLLQTGHTITRQLQEVHEDSTEHDSIVKTLEHRWGELYEQIRRYETDIEQSMNTEQFRDELQALANIRTEYQTWLESISPSTSAADIQVKFKTFQSYTERLANLRRMSDRFDINTIKHTDDLLRSWDETHSLLRERSIPVERMQPQPSGIASSGVSSVYQTNTSSVSTSPNRGLSGITSTVHRTGTSASPIRGLSGVTSSGVSSVHQTGTSTNQTRASSGIANSGVSSVYYTGTSSIPVSVDRGGLHDQTYSASSTSTSTTASNINPSIGENGSVFTLTNIYTFGGDGNSNQSLSDHQTQPGSDKYRVKSFVEVFDQPTAQHETEYERHYRETHSSSSVTRKIRTSATDTYDYDQNGNYDSSRSQHHYESTIPDKSTITSKFSGTDHLSQLSSTFIDIHRKLRLWLEHVEQSLLSDKLRLVDLSGINVKKRVYKDLFDQALEQEHNLESLTDSARDYHSKLTIEHSGHLQDELISYRNRLNDIKMFLSNGLAKCNRFEQTLSDFENSVEEVHLWIRNAQPRLAMSDATHGGSRALENQLGRNQALQQEIREMQTTVNRLNRDVVELTQHADEKLVRRLRDEMQRLNESWSRMISSTKVYSQNIQDALKRNKVLEEEIRELEDWILEKDREAPVDDGQIFYQDQLRERLDQYQKLQTELNLKEHSVRHLVDQIRQDVNQSSHTADHLVSHWSNLQKKIDTKTTYYTDVHRLHEELKDLLQRETVWLDQLQTKIYATVTNGADAEEISEELDSLERFVKTHSKNNYERILDIADRLQTLKVSLTSTTGQISQFQLRWQQLHEEALKKLHALNSQVTDYQQMGHEVTAMFEWMKHTDSTLNARLKDDVYADDVPGETEKLLIEFNQYELFLRSIEDKIHTLRSLGKTDAARRLEQQFILLKNQFTQLQNKFRQFQKPSDFEPKYAQMRQILQGVEQNMYTLDIRSDDPDIVHSQLEHCLKLYKTLSDIKSEVEYVIRVGRGIVEKRQTHESNDFTRQIDQLKTTYNNLGAKVSSRKSQLDSVERHLRKFRKEYSHVQEWFAKADIEIRKIENKQVSKNTKEEVDWIRTTRNDIKKMEGNFETLRTLEHTIQKEAERQLPSLHEKTTELKRQIDQLDRRLRDRSDVVEGQVRRLDDEHRRFGHLYEEILRRLDKLESLLSDAERVLDLTRISQVQEELRSVRTQLDEMLSLGQELVSKSEKYNKLVGPDIETITRKFEELQRRIRIVQETQEKRTREHQTTASTTGNKNIQDDQHDDVRREFYSEKRYQRTEHETRARSPSESSEFSTTHGVIDEEFKKKYLRCLAYMKLIERLYENQRESDEDSDVTTHRRTSRRDRTIRDRPEYEEIERIICETEERACIIEKTDVEQAHRIRSKILRLRDCLENLRLRSEQHQTNDEIVRYNERYEERIRTTDRTVPREREFDSDFIYDIDDTRSVISEPAPFPNTKYRKTVHSLERYRADDHSRHVPAHAEYQLQPLLRVRSLKAIDNRALSAPSSPILQPRYRSYERSNIQYTKQAANQQGHQDNYQSSISKSASMPNGGFPVHQNLLSQLPPPPPPPHFYPQQPMMYRERVIDKHVAERSTSRGESHRQQHQESTAHNHQQQQHHHQQQQQQQHQQNVRSASTSGQSQTLNRSIPVRYEGSNTNATAGSYRQATGFTQESYPNYFYNEQQTSGGGTSGGGGTYRQQYHDQQAMPPQHVSHHPTRIVN